MSLFPQISVVFTLKRDFSLQQIKTVPPTKKRKENYRAQPNGYIYKITATTKAQESLWKQTEQGQEQKLNFTQRTTGN